MTDLGEDIARAVIAAIDAGDGWHAALDSLRMLEPSGANRNGVATKILTLADMPDGHAILERIAANARARYLPLVQPASDAQAVTDAPTEKGNAPIKSTKANSSISIAAESRFTLGQREGRLSAAEIARRHREDRRRQ